MTTRRRLPATSNWAVLLAGPIVGTAYFFIVYLIAELSCATETALLGTGALRVVIVVGAVAAAATLIAYALRGAQLWRADDAHTDERMHDDAGEATRPELVAERRDSGRFMITIGLMLLSMFLLFVLFLAAPSIGGALC